MRTDQQLIDVLGSVQAAPGGFGPEHVSLCHDVRLRLKSLLEIEAAKDRALEGNRELVRELATAILVLKELDQGLDQGQVEAAIRRVVEKHPEREKYAPRLNTGGWAPNSWRKP